MNKIEILNQIFKLCIVPLLAILTTYLVNLIRKKSNEIQEGIDSSIANKYLDMLTDTIVSCVISTNQTYVNELKDQNAFDKEAQLEAFKRTYQAVMSILGEDAKEALGEFYGDLPTLVTQLIEMIVADNRYEPKKETKAGF